MKKIRPTCFESNSSSMHSIVIDKESKVFESYSPDEQGRIVLWGGEWGWGPENHYDVESRMNYAAVGVHLYGRNKEMFEKVVKEHTGAKELVYKFSGDDFWDKPNPDNLSLSYIDHQSIDVIDDAMGSEEDLKRFIFGPKSVLIIDNDNY